MFVCLLHPLTYPIMRPHSSVSLFIMALHWSRPGRHTNHKEPCPGCVNLLDVAFSQRWNAAPSKYRDVREMVHVCWCMFEDILTVVGGCDKHASVFVSISLRCKFPCLGSSKSKQQIISLRLRWQTSRRVDGLEDMGALVCDVGIQHGWAGFYRSKYAHTIRGTIHLSLIFQYCTHQSVTAAKTQKVWYISCNK